MLIGSFIIILKLPLIIDGPSIQVLHTSIVAIPISKLGVFRPHFCEFFKLFITDWLWVVYNKELGNFSARWSSEAALIVVHLLNVKFLYESIDLNVGRIGDHIVMQVLHLELLNKSVVLVASQFPVKENADHCMGISLIFILTSMDHVQFQVKLMSSNCVL